MFRLPSSPLTRLSLLPPIFPFSPFALWTLFSQSRKTRLPVLSLCHFVYITILCTCLLWFQPGQIARLGSCLKSLSLSIKDQSLSLSLSINRQHDHVNENVLDKKKKKKREALCGQFKVKSSNIFFQVTCSTWNDGFELICGQIGPNRYSNSYTNKWQSNNLRSKMLPYNEQ